MDPISFGLGIISIASAFQTCIHGYRSLTTAMAIGETALNLSIQFRVEELRLLMWGRDWGLIKVEEDSKIKKTPGPDSDSEDDIVGGADEAEGEDAVAIEKPMTLLDTVDEDLEIPGLQEVTIEVLGRISKTLEDWRSVGQKYGAAPTGKNEGSALETGSASQSSRDMLSNVASKQAKQSKDISSRNKITSKIRWALKDKQDLEELLASLTKLNDSLQKLLPRRERASLARGLAGELLNILENGSVKDSGSEIDDQLSHLDGTDEVKAARIICLKRSNQTEKPEKPEIGEEAMKGATPFAKASAWIEGESKHIPFSHFLKLPEPKLTQLETHDDKGRWIKGKYVPLQRSLAVYAPIAQSPKAFDITPADTAGLLTTVQPAEATLVEWRPTAHESRASELTDQDLKERRDHIARLLSRTSNTDVEFRVLDCLGYTTTNGHTADGSTHSLVGYVYRYPEFASPKSLPVSLRDLLGEAYKTNSPKVPPLEVRFKLARNLAIALYQLQCAGWVHRKLSSYNVIFFRDSTTDELDLNQPFLVGWQYSRPDDQRRLFPSEQGNEGIGDLDMYVHRMRLTEGGHGRYPRFRKSFDIYSLGIILMEIAFWEPIIALTDEAERKKMELRNDTISSGYRAKLWWKSILATAKEEIAPEMGSAYQDAVLFCLLGGQAASKVDPRRYYDRDEESREEYYVDKDFEEVGIEKEFYWKVLKPLERFGR